METNTLNMVCHIPRKCTNTDFQQAKKSAVPTLDQSTSTDKHTQVNIPKHTE